MFTPKQIYETLTISPSTLRRWAKRFENHLSVEDHTPGKHREYTVEDLNIFNVGDVDPTFFEQLPRLADKFASRASPAVRIPYAFITGHTALSRRPTRELTGETWEKSFWNLTKAYSPTSRFQRVG